MKMSRPILIIAILTVLAVLYMVWRDHKKEAVPPVSARRSSASVASMGSAPVSTVSVEGQSIVIEEVLKTPAGQNGSTPMANPLSTSDKDVPKQVNLFAAQTWAPPPPPPSPPSSPQEQAEIAKKNPPQAPPLPFTVASTWRESGIVYIGLLANGENVIVCQRCTLPGSVKPGDVVMHNYRLDQIGDRSLVFTFLPLKQKQELPIGEMP